MDINEFEYEFLKGEWSGPSGAALWETMEFCRNSGLGDYGKPTAKGYAAIQQYEMLKWNL